ncbi:hypothetical protein LSTR_LSTR010531 [Laodelphax striatellus]|uniref:Uncharacterized protein n=1 Tax=Laodelphax striatellus TaxID=195883 RepID=A0A482X2D4_LAOST|nr:hypothetical protein LSTR_LSTR010531 [Laodelphax striatellus]
MSALHARYARDYVTLRGHPWGGPEVKVGREGCSEASVTIFYIPNLFYFGYFLKPPSGIGLRRSRATQFEEREDKMDSKGKKKEKKNDPLNMSAMCGRGKPSHKGVVTYRMRLKRG